MTDIHSYFDEMTKALNEKEFDINNNDHVLIVCGDLFDRGEQSVELFEFVKSIPKDRFIYVRGNHEDLLIGCVNDISRGKTIGSHHFHNKTVNTICQFAGIKLYPFDRCVLFDVEERKKIRESIKPLIDFIEERAVDYAEIGDKIFVHGWIPLDVDWRNADTESWKQARWYNGMDYWKRGIIEEGKTIYCGHWHCSYGWSYIDQKRKEFPQKNKKNWTKSFEPYVKEGIVALDACTAYSGICNCIVFEE